MWGFRLLALGLGLLCGCSHPLEIHNLSDYSRRTIDHSGAGLSVALALETPSPGNDLLTQEIAFALVSQGGYRVIYPASVWARPDVEAKISIVSEREGSFGNFFVAWPGSLIFAHAWAGYGYTATFEIHCELIAPDRGERLGSMRFPVHLDLSHADFGRSWANCFLWPFTSPFAFLNGIWCVHYDPDVDAPLHREAFPPVAGHVASAIIRTLSACPPNVTPRAPARSVNY